VRPEAKPDKIDQILRGGMIGGGIEAGREPVSSLDLMQNEHGQLAARDRTRNLVVRFLQTSASRFCGMRMLQRPPSVSCVSRAGSSPLIRVICPLDRSIDRPRWHASNWESDATIK